MNERPPLRVIRPVPSAPKPSAAPDWEIRLDTWPKKLIVIVLILATSGLMIYRTSWLFLAAWITRGPELEPAIYERAVAYDPGNAEYRFVLAQIYNYSTQYLNTERAGEMYEAAVRLNPHRASYWLELSKYHEQEDNLDGSRDAMQMALQTDPNFAQTHWAAANLYVRLNELAAADLELRRTADLDPNTTTQVLDLVWQMYRDPEFIMTTHIPNTKPANLTALNYFINQSSPDGAAIAWDRLKTFETTHRERFPYVEYLIAQALPHESWDVFLAGKESGLIYNGDFDTETLNGGFDWRIRSWDNAEARRDTTTVKEGLSSYMVSFNGKENVSYSHLWHWLPVEKGKPYVLQFWMKTDGISTNEGVFVDVDGQTSEKQVGTTYWQEFNIPFTASNDLVRVTLRRVPSDKFDNLLKGKVWLDSFSLTPVP